MKVHEKLYKRLKCPKLLTTRPLHADPEVGGGGGGGGRVKLCQTQSGLKLDLLWSESLRKLSGAMHVLVWTMCLHLCSKFVEV